MAETCTCGHTEDAHADGIICDECDVCDEFVTEAQWGEYLAKLGTPVE